ncbi:twin transmembrane helix small protein [Glycocaulis profundi]|jgi:hypothetical protein|nr:twin transmembrane helix small protein [Glycocaulis profundi]
MAQIVDIFLILVLLSVVGALGFGIFAMVRGGEFGRKWSNRMMRARVGLQFLAVILIVGGIWLKTTLGS